MSHSARVSWNDARSIATTAGLLLPAETVGLNAAVGRVLRSPVVAALDIPHYASAAMDGWAVSGPGPWRLHNSVPLGSTPLAAGEATSIVTGGLLPEGSDAVVPTERTSVSGDTLVLDSPEARTHIRPAAEEARVGDTLVSTGTRLSPAHVALAASAAVDQLEVAVRPRVALVFSGDEIVLSGIPAAGQVRDSFGPTFPAIVGTLGAETVGSTRVGDDRAATTAALRNADADVIVTTGGTGDSHADHLRRALDELGAEYLVAGFAARPGGPTLLARLPSGTLVLGLPGNPLAAMLGLLSLGEPLVAGFTGRLLPPLATVSVPPSVKRHPVATRLVPVRAGLDEFAWTGAAMMRGLAAATAVLVVPPEGDAQVLPLPWAVG